VDSDRKDRGGAAGLRRWPGGGGRSKTRCRLRVDWAVQLRKRPRPSKAFFFLLTRSQADLGKISCFPAFMRSRAFIFKNYI
jgi:hypothetical protein